MTEYAIWLADPAGRRVIQISQYQSLTYTLVENSPGACTLILPATFDRRLLVLDARLEIWRSVDGLSWRLDGDRIWWIRNPGGEDSVATDGKKTVTVRAPGAPELLERRIVAYDAGSAYAKKTAKPGDMMKAIARENMGALATDVTRTLASICTIQADAGEGISQSKAFSRRTLLDVFQEISTKADTDGSPVYFDIVATPISGGTTLELRTFAGQRGTDRRYPSGTNPVLLSGANRNFGDERRNDNYAGEINYVYAGGPGEGAARTIATASDPARIGLSALNRREGFINAVQADTTPALQAEAGSALKKGQPVRTFSGKLIDSPGTRYGVNYFVGDRITAQTYRGERIDVRVHQVTINQAGNQESITPELSFA